MGLFSWKSKKERREEIISNNLDVLYGDLGRMIEKEAFSLDGLTYSTRPDTFGNPICHEIELALRDDLGRAYTINVSEVDVAGRHYWGLDGNRNGDGSIFGETKDFLSIVNAFFSASPSNLEDSFTRNLIKAFPGCGTGYAGIKVSRKGPTEISAVVSEIAYTRTKSKPYLSPKYKCRIKSEEPVFEEENQVTKQSIESAIEEKAANLAQEWIAAGEVPKPSWNDFGDSSWRFTPAMIYAREESIVNAITSSPMGSLMDLGTRIQGLLGPVFDSCRVTIAEDLSSATVRVKDRQGFNYLVEWLSNYSVEDGCYIAFDEIIGASDIEANIADFFGAVSMIHPIKTPADVHKALVYAEFQSKGPHLDHDGGTRARYSKRGIEFEFRLFCGNAARAKSALMFPDELSTENSALQTESVPFDGMTGEQFESFCAGILRSNGFLDVEITKGSGDQGVDILATKDFVKYGFQCKCYSSDIGNKAVQEAFAGKTYYGCHVAMVITNRYFTPAAKELAAQTGVVLWDRDKLLSMVGE